MPVPHYLKNNSENIIEKDQYTKFDFACDCRNKTFYLSKNTFSKEEKNAIKPYVDFLTAWYTSHLPKKTAEDENGITHYFMQSNYPNREWIELIMPECPSFVSVAVIKAKCSCCGREFTLFDSRFHGYDGKYCKENSKEEIKYIPTMKQVRNKTNTPVQLSFKIESIETYEEFASEMEENVSFEDYTDAFSWIWIYSIGENGKKRIVFEMETA